MREMDNSFDLLSVAEVSAKVPQLKKKWNLIERIQDRANNWYSKKDVDVSAGKTMLLGKVKKSHVLILCTQGWALI